jgi:uncharacterized protein YeaO (DUF488 family)
VPAAALVSSAVRASSVMLKRAYDPPAASDGQRILVDRLWPRGVSKGEARLDDWIKDIAPSTELRTWFGHDLGRWGEFRRRYRAELKQHIPLVDELRGRADKEPITLVYAARDEAHNHAVVLRNLILGRSDQEGRLP